MRLWKTSVALLVLVGAGVVVAPRVDDLKRWYGEMAGASTPPQQAAPPAMPPMPVPVVAAVRKSLPVLLEYPARTEAVARTALQSKVSGYLVEQVVPEGADVKAGDLLYRLDPRDYDLAIEQARAQLDRNVASLDYLKSSLDRGTDLAKSGYLSKDTFDQRSSAVRQAESALAIDRTAIKVAELNRSYTEIRAPFAGRLGKNQASLGTLVGAGSTVLNTLVQIAPVYVTFGPSEPDLVRVRKAMSEGKVEAEVVVPGEASRKGELSFLDNALDANTGTILARATLANADGGLLPGQYVRIRLLLGQEPDMLMVPQAALGSSQFGKYLYVVGQGNKVEMRPVTVGRTDGELVSVVAGLKDSDQVITGNLQKIGPGAPVSPMPAKVASTR
ncbi:efflux RND transporter periplasmic adaptor subunit [uncultured Alsobacter sp.]|uniref:efflux RND transporter periplasmic adaptor subunit n=1 Tax=uncultured Alsobacter sp. TaxID=1748258 RepID=UPI0025E43CFC|nr:efflux RND transporter periplasmic adaptor subunit [uncultured Alsobacter sp.]